MQITLNKSVYNLENEEKVNRAINGSIQGQGQAVGGVGEDAQPEEIITEYDRLGGLITLEKIANKGLVKKYKVKTGSFFDFAKKKSRTKPEVTLSLRGIDGEEIEITQDDEIPLEVQAAEAKAEKKTASKKKAKEESVDETEE